MHEAGSAGTRSWLEDRFLALVRGAGFNEAMIDREPRAVLGQLAAQQLARRVAWK
jgi:hypothetical protein